MRILAIGAHPDDVEVGCGGLFTNSTGLCKGVVVCSTGAATGKETAEVRTAEALHAAKLMNTSFFRQGSFPILDLVLGRDLVSFVEGCIKEFSPDIVLTHWGKDTHQDHPVVTQAVFAAMRKGGQLFLFESLSSIDFCPTVFSNVEYVQKKIDVVAVHESQNATDTVAGLTLAEYVGAMATHRGVQSRNFSHAEGFLPFRSYVDWR